MIPVGIDSVISVGIEAVIPAIDTTLCHVIDSLFHGMIPVVIDALVLMQFMLLMM